MIGHLFQSGGGHPDECRRCSELSYDHGQVESMPTCAYCGAFSIFRNTKNGPLWELPCQCGLWGPGETAATYMAKMRDVDPIAELLRIQDALAVQVGLPLVALRLRLGASR